MRLAHSAVLTADGLYEQTVDVRGGFMSQPAGITWALLLVGVGAGIGLGALAIAVRNARRAAFPANATMVALRCPVCNVDWPQDPAHYGVCPLCLTSTEAIAGEAADPIDPSEARSIRLHHEFERFYAARGSR